MTRLAIVGSREFANPHWQHLASAYIRGALAHLQPEAVVSGGADGIDTLGVKLAVEHGIPPVEHRPQAQSWDAPGGYRDRNQRIAQDCTHLLSIRCAESSSYGSGWTADHAESLGREVFRREIDPRDTVDIYGYCWCGPAYNDPIHGAWHKLAEWNAQVFSDAEADRQQEFDRKLADRERRAFQDR